VQSPTTTTADTNDGMKRSSSEGTSLWAKFKRAGACISFPRSQTVNDKLSDIVAVEEKEEDEGVINVHSNLKGTASGGAEGKTTNANETTNAEGETINGERETINGEKDPL
jgi:hypothetical protein